MAVVFLSVKKSSSDESDGVKPPVMFDKFKLLYFADITLTWNAAAFS